MVCGVVSNSRDYAVVAVGDCAFDGGLFSQSYAVEGGVAAVIPVDLHIKGCPPAPFDLLKGLLALMQESPRGYDLSAAVTRQGP